MTFTSNRKGSALLIVLGMMAFIIVSAVAFSAYMRAARMPSSYLRRSSSSRLLVKAALAEAIEEIDAAIGNNPHPGVGTRQFRHPRESGDLMNRNLWAEHVYIGSTNQSSGTIDQSIVSPSETVSTLCVEALAYIPPPLINEARYYSRRSTAARWHDMGFDSGRYAFCAIDVSDCLDINRVTAGSGLDAGSEREIPAGRNSSDTGRITLAHAFENSNHTGYQSTVTPADWDKFMDNYLTEDGRADSSKVPLVSVADMNLAVRKNLNKAANDLSPFCRVFENGGDFVQSDDDFHRSTMFVTDSVMAATNAVGGTFDLSNPAHQPFYGFPDDKPDTNDATFDKLMQQSNAFLDKYQNELSAPEVVQLYDYLDQDSVPVTLAMPTVERTPMVVAMSLEAQLNMSVEKTDLPEKQINENVRYRGVAYTLKFGGNLTAAIGLVFPFKYRRGDSPKPFKAQAAATITLVPCNEAGYKSLRLPSAAAPAVFLRDGWEPGAQESATASYPGKTLPSVITVRSRELSLDIPGDGVKQESEAAIDDITLQLPVNVPFGSELPENDKFAQKSVCTMRVAQKQVKAIVDGMVTWQDDTTEPPVVEYGALPSNGDLSDALDVSDSVKYAPVVQAWARIVDENNRTVDLVPACTADDENPSALLNGEQGCGPRPVLRFWDGDPDTVAEPQSVVAFTEAGLGAYGTKNFQIWPKGWLADDPRFNYAPENMIAIDDVGSEFKTLWLERQRSPDRDGDIFMAVSDAGYMQSKYELANLLRITGFNGGGDGFGTASGSAYNGAIRKSFENTAADGSMWRTYSQYAAERGSDEIASKFSAVTGGSRGYRVNPYTRSKDVMMTALANSPLDWWAASTNDAVDKVKQTQLSSIAESDKYTFSEHSGAQVQLKHEKLEELAKYMQSQFGGSDSVEKWQSLFDNNMGWDNDNERELGGTDLGVALHTVDRKFLHGFWRECFDTRQQLFLVFVRAEPMMMGGGAVGQMPPQLGARAVALVWRDPTATVEDAGASQPRPHRSRILFYRQFD